LVCRFRGASKFEGLGFTLCIDVFLLL
jgi:hypothetical protein